MQMQKRRIKEQAAANGVEIETTLSIVESDKTIRNVIIECGLNYVDMA